MFFLIYKTTNKLNGKFYIGAHKTKRKNDTYLGSGVALNRAVIKYGKQNFEREILFECASESEMYVKESELISQIKSNTHCYNLNVGGKGGWDFVNASGMHNGANNIMNRNAEIKTRVISSMRETRASNKEHFDIISNQNLTKAIQQNRGKKRPKHACLIKSWSKEYWSRNKEKMRDALASTFVVTSPTGESFETNRLQDFCKERNLAYTSVWSTSRTGKAISKGRSKGWICKKLNS
jgi:hypothetical protein